jgi:hypothetical protein
LERPRKTTSGRGESGGKERRELAEKRKEGGWAVKVCEAVASWAGVGADVVM